MRAFPQADSDVLDPARAGFVVLVAEDHFELREMIAAVLHGDGYTVLSAADGLAALAILERTRADVLLLDVRMPGLNGVELARRVRATADAIPIILTGGGAGDERYVDEVGAFGFLPKPYDIRLLLDWLADACGHARDAPQPT